MDEPILNKSKSFIDKDAEHALEARKKALLKQTVQRQRDEIRRRIVREQSILFERQQELKRLQVEKVRLRSKTNEINARYQVEKNRYEAEQRRLEEQGRKIAELQSKAKNITQVLTKEEQLEKSLIEKFMGISKKEKADYENAKRTYESHKRAMKELEEEAKRIQSHFAQKISSEMGQVVQAKIALERETREMERAEHDIVVHEKKPDEIKAKIVTDKSGIESNINSLENQKRKAEAIVSGSDRVIKAEEKELEKIDTHLKGIDSSLYKIVSDIHLQEGKIDSLQRDLRKAEKEFGNDKPSF